MIENGDKLYVIQINMADPNQNPEWDNCDAYQDKNQALTQIEWMKGEYRIDVVNFYAKA